MLDLENSLNQSQVQAVSHVHGPLLVIAGAGSGKTRVITYRVANLVHNHGVHPSRILAVTFTNKAAKEMKERISQLLGSQGIDCWVSTFHASCAKFLRFYGKLASIDPAFTIYDDLDQKAMVTRCIKELQYDDKKLQPKVVQNQINRSKQELQGWEDYPTSDPFRRQVKEVFELYEKQMRDASALDFGDLLFCTVRAMQQTPDFLTSINSRFDFVLVDEFQDTNRAQLEMIRLLALPHSNICVVGDDDQSIYSWRGADVTNILDFGKRFDDVTTVTLDRNYRSTANILKAAHGVVDKLYGRHPKELWTSAAAGEKIGLVEARSERQEAELVARAVRELKDDGFPLNEQVIFYRINAQSRVFEEVFMEMGIPHRVLGGMRFYERAEVKDVLAYLRLIQNPADIAAFLRIINKPTRGIGKATVDRLRALAAGNGISMYDAIDHPAALDQIGVAGEKRLRAFREFVEIWRSETKYGPSHLAKRVLEDTGYLAKLKAEDSPEADVRIENLSELLGSIEDFEADASTPSLGSFLELITLQTDLDTADFENDQVTLMTVHSAKGLEFDVVHVTGLEEGLFPILRGSDGYMSEDEKEIEEERRLCYVAMTRAKKRLFLNYANQRRIFGRLRQEPRSRFLNDISSDLVVELTAKRPQVELLGTSPYERSSSHVRSVGGAEPSYPRRPPQPPKAKKNQVWIDRSFDQSQEGVSLSIGQTVSHPRYGEGRVVDIHQGERPKAVVDFADWGQKIIVVDYLKPC